MNLRLNMLKEPWLFKIFAAEFRVTEAGNRLSADTDCNGKRAAAA
jgi:hypothetical protein